MASNDSLVPGYDLSSGYKLRFINGAWKFHAGLDWVAKDGPGTPVPAAVDGIVIYTGFNSGLGNTVIVRSEDSSGQPYATLYAHMQGPKTYEKWTLGPNMPMLGAEIRKGDIVGLEGNTGSFSKGAHSHQAVIVGPDFYKIPFSGDGGSLTFALTQFNTVDPRTVPGWGSGWGPGMPSIHYRGETLSADQTLSWLNPYSGDGTPVSTFDQRWDWNIGDISGWANGGQKGQIGDGRGIGDWWSNMSTATYGKRADLDSDVSNAYAYYTGPGDDDIPHFVDTNNANSGTQGTYQTTQTSGTSSQADNSSSTGNLIARVDNSSFVANLFNSSFSAGQGNFGSGGGGSSWWDDLLNGASSAWDNVTNFFGDAWSGISDAFSDVGSWFDNVGGWFDDIGGFFGDFSFPVILDLSGNGINITKLSSSNTFVDMKGDGYKSLTAWAGVGSGVLFVDLSGQGQLTQKNQFVFTDWDPGATSDMQALLDVFDTNHNGMLDAGDANFSKFFVMVTNADGTQTAKSLAQLGISSINLNANTKHVDLGDGSSIDGETTFTITNPTTGITTTNVAATVTLASNAAGYLVATTSTLNADGSRTIANTASNADGSIAYQRILNTSADGLSKTLTDLSNVGVVSTIQTDNTVVNGDGSRTETVTNYAGGTIQANGQLTASGTTGSQKLNSTITTTSANGQVVTILRDQLGGGWTTQQEVDTRNGDGSSSIVISDLNPDGSASNVTTTSVSADGLTRTTTSLVDNIAANSIKSIDSIVVNGTTRTETVTNSAGTTVTSLITTVTETTANSVTRTTTSDLTDGVTLNLTSVATTVTNANGSTTTTQTDKNADGSLRAAVVTQLSADGLQKTTSVDSTGLTASGGAPVFDSITADNTVVNADGSRTETVIVTSGDNTQLSKSITTRAASGPNRDIVVWENGLNVITHREGVWVDPYGLFRGNVTEYAADGSITSGTSFTISADGLSKTVQIDSNGDNALDHITTDVTTMSGGISTETVTNYGANTSNLIDVTQTTISANGLTSTTRSDFIGVTGGRADGTWDQVAVDQTVVNGDGSLTETITVSDGNSHVLNQTTKATSADRKTVTINSTLGATNLVKQTETITTQANGDVVDKVVHFAQNGDVLGATVTTTSADGLTKTVQNDVQGHAAAAYAANGLAFDATTKATTVINADGSRTTTTDVRSANNALVATSSTQTTANGLSVTTTNNPFATAHYATRSTDAITLNNDGSSTRIVSDYNYNAGLIDRQTTITSANSLSTTVLHDLNGDGVVDQTSTDITTLNANGSRTEVVTDYTGGTSGTVRDITTTTSGVIVQGAGLKTTITRQSNGSVPTYQVETISPSANGTVTDATKFYSQAGGTLLKTTTVTTSANGLTKVSGTAVGANTSNDFWTSDTIVLNADGSRTETVLSVNKSIVINETVTTTSANGLSKTTSIDANGALNGSNQPIFNLVTTDNTVLNTADGSRTQTITNTSANGGTISRVVKNTSADQQRVTIDHYLNQAGNITRIERAEVIQTQADGSIVDTVTNYSASASLGTIVTTSSGNGLYRQTVYKNGAGSTIDTQTTSTTYNANGDGGTLRSFDDAYVVTGSTMLGSSIRTQAAANGQTSTTTMALTGALAASLSASFTAVANASVAISDAGVTTQTVTSRINGSSNPYDTTVTVTSANGLSKTTSTTLGSDVGPLIVQQQTTALDGSRTATTTYYNHADLTTVLDQLTVNVSYDGRTITSTRMEDYDRYGQTVVNNHALDPLSPATYTPTFGGTGYNVEQTVFVTNADGTTKETRSGTGSFGAPAYLRVDSTILNPDSTVTTFTTFGDARYVDIGQSASVSSPNGLVKATVIDPTAGESRTTLIAAATALANSTALPSSMLLTDILIRDYTALNTDGSKSEWIETWFGQSNVRSKTYTLTSANGLKATSNIDNDGNGINERTIVSTKLPDGSSVTVYNYYGNTSATQSTLVGTNTYTTSANGLSTVLTTSTGITETKVQFAQSNGSSQYSRVVGAGSAAAAAGLTDAAASHSIDANGIDTWTSTANGTTTTITIDVATEQRAIETANGIFQTLFGHQMDEKETQFLNRYIVNGVYNREQHAYDLISTNPDYLSNYGVKIKFGNETKTVFQGFNIIAAFENALGRRPTAQELGTFEQFLTVHGAGGAAQTLDDIATMIVAIAQYVADLDGVDNRTPSDPNVQLVSMVSTAPSWISPASNAVQIEAAGTYNYTGRFIADLNSTTLQGVQAPINGNNNVILAGNGSNLTVSGFNNTIDNLYGTATISTSNATILIESGTAALVTGDRNQIAQVGPTQLTVGSGSNYNAIFISAAPLPSNPLTYWQPYSTTTASNTGIMLATGVGSAAAPALIYGTQNAISITGNDVVTIVGANNQLYVSGGNDTIAVSNSTVNFYSNNNISGVTIKGTGNHLTGTFVDTQLLGSTGNDTFYSGHGNVKVVGGDGLDTMVLTGNRANYQVSYIPSAHMTVLTDLRLGSPDGVISSQEVENFQFADGTVAYLGDQLPVVTAASINATHFQTIAASSLMTATDADGEPITKYQFWDGHHLVDPSDDNPAVDDSGYFKLNGIRQAEGVAFEVTAAQMSSLVFQTVSGPDILWARAFDGYGWSPTWTQITVNAPTNHAPVVTVSNKSLPHDTTVAASSLFTVNDVDGDSVFELQFYDDNATSDQSDDHPSPDTTGYFIFNGVRFGAGQNLQVTAAQLGSLYYHTSSAGSSDLLWVRASDGNMWSSFPSFTVTATNSAPVAVASGMNVTSRNSIAASSLFSVTDANNDAITMYRLWDDNGAADSGYFRVNGVVQASGTTITLTPDQLAHTTFQTGGVSDLLYVQAFDGTSWSTTWTSFTITEQAPGAPGSNHAPVTTAFTLNATHGQVFSAAALVSASDADGNAITKYQFWDDHRAAGTGDDNPAVDDSGAFLFNGVALPEGKWIEVSAAELSSLTFRSGSQNDMIYVRVFDGYVWSASTITTVATPTNTAPVVTPINKSAHIGTSFLASSLFTVSDQQTDTIQKYQIGDWTTTGAIGHFTLGGVTVANGGPIEISAAQLSQLSFVNGNATGTDAIWIKAFDGLVWSDWSNVSVTATNNAPTATASYHSYNVHTSVALSSLVSATDPDGDGITKYAFWDDNGATGTGDDHPAVDNTGYILVDGLIQPTGTEIVLTLDQLSRATFETGSSSDILYVRAFDGVSWGTSWTQFNMSEQATATPAGNHAPTAGVTNLTAAHGQTFTANQMVSGSDADGNAITKYQFWDGHRLRDTSDDNPTIDDSGYFKMNGVVLPEGQPIEVSASALSSLSFKTNTGIDYVWARAFDGYEWGAWEPFTVSTATNNKPIVVAPDFAITVNTSVSVSSLFSVSDSDGDTIQKYQFWDGTAGATSGNFFVAGQQQATNTAIEVLAADLSQASYVAGTVTAADNLYVRVFDGYEWTGWQNFHAYAN